MGTKEFKVGDKVRWADPAWVPGCFSLNKVYTVNEANDDCVYLKEVVGGWFHCFFEKVEDWNAAEADVKDEEILASVSEALTAENSYEGIVTKPAHYTRWKIEPVEFLLKNDVPGHVFNIVKYTMRAGYKLYPNQDATQSEITDLRKAIRYCQMRINLLEGKSVL